FLWVEDPKKKTAWHLPYREGAGGIDPDTGMYRQAGEVNLGALRAIAAAAGGARTGKPMSMPAEIKSKLERLLKQYKIGAAAETAEARGDDETSLVELNEQNVAMPFAGSKIDKEHNVVRSVVLLGEQSESHNRYYSKKALKDFSVLLEGSRVYADHEMDESARAKRGGVRSVKDLIGMTKDVVFHESESKVRGDFHYLANHKPWIEALVESMSDKVAFSIHGFGMQSSDAQGKNRVENGKSVRSVDLVTEGATTKTLFESGHEQEEKDMQMDLTKISLAELREARPDLAEAIAADAKAEAKVELDTSQLVESMKKTAVEQAATIKELKTKVDTFETKERVAAKKAKIETALTESKIPKEFISPTFRETLESADTDERVKKLIDDRKKLVEGKDVGVHESGDETEIGETNKTKGDGGKTVKRDGVEMTASEAEFADALHESGRGA
ncbi:MAG: hypothetical protein IMZ71_04615, partial [Chloroflexi bacterium]|nr:hypothetical protein [Chloroflexota bacterium]